MLGKFRIQSAGGRPIQSLDDWFAHAPPQKGVDHWVDGRSAKELARRWLSDELPPEIDELLESNRSSAGFVVEEVIPELRTAFDEYGGPRHHDLVVVGRIDGIPTLLAIEGKADEAFGDDLRAKLRIAEQKRAKGENSNVPSRISLLSKGLFGQSDLTALGDLRYQLLHAVAGTLVEARSRGCARALFVVHEFHSHRTAPNNLARNAADLDAFVSKLLGRPIRLQSGIMVGPIQIPGGEFIPSTARADGAIELYIGKAVASI